VRTSASDPVAEAAHLGQTVKIVTPLKTLTSEQICKSEIFINNQLGSKSSRISLVFLTMPMRGKILATVSACSSADMADMASSAKI